MNPPYGVRIGEDEELKELYELMGNILKTNCQGSNAYVLSGSPELSKNIGLKAEKNIVLKNGKLDCRLLFFPILAGKYDNWIIKITSKQVKDEVGKLAKNVDLSKFIL